MYEKKKNDGIYDAYLAHQGVLGMKWGHRRYQNEDGSYKPGAEGRYYTPVGKKQQKRNYKDIKKYRNKENELNYRIRNQVDQVATKEQLRKIYDDYEKFRDTFTNAKDFSESKEFVELSERAEKQVDDFLKKNPDYYNELKRDAEEGGFDVKDHRDYQKMLESYTWNSDLTDVYEQKFEENNKYTEKKSDVYWDAYENGKEAIVDAIVGKYGKKKVNDVTVSDVTRKAVDTYITKVGQDGIRAKQIETNSKNITEQVSNQLISDLKKWDSDDGKSKSKEEYSKIADSIQKQLSKELKNYSNYEYADSADTFKDGTITFGISGFSNYSDSAPLTIDYNPKTKKVTGIYYT